MKFDPMTGQPIQEEPVERQPIGFDPHTGAPIFAEPAQPEQPAQQVAQPEQPAQAVTRRFDPMTGQPITGTPAQPAQPTVQPVPSMQQTGFDPMTGQPLYGANPAPAQPQKKKMKKGAKAAIIIGAVVVVCLAVAIPVFAIFNSKEARVARAIYNTFQDGGEITKALKDSKVLDQKEYTFSAELEANNSYETVSMSLDYLKAKDAKEVIFDIVNDGKKIDVTAILDKETISLASSELNNQIIQYNYTQPMTGILSSYVDAQTLQALNEALAKLYSGDQNTYQKELKNVLKTITVSSAGKRQYLVDGKMRNCSGYMVAVNETAMVNLMRAYAGNAMSYGEISELFEDMPTIMVYFYVYKNKLAAVEMSVQGDTASIEFQGGDFRWQNMEFKVNNMSMAKLTGSSAGGMETGKLSLYSYYNDSFQETFHYTYNAGSGILEIGGVIDGDEVSAELRITHAKGAFAIELEDISYAGMKMSSTGYSINAKITVQSGAAIVPISGNVIHVNSFSADDVEGIDNIIDDVF